MAQISLDGISFCYPGSSENTLDSLNLEIANGEAHALLGASGAGKTTLLNILSGLLVPTAGALRFNGVDVAALPGSERGVAQVFQFPVLYEGMTVAENLAFPLKTRKVDAGKIAERTDYICDELDIHRLRGKKIGRLSLFEKQLIAVGKALMRADVSLVLLDEPLTAVEPKVKWRLRQSLRRVQADLGVTMIYVTHDQTEALTFADRVSVLTTAGILQTGTPEEVYQAPDHEFVGHFVGSPGMNFVPSRALGLNVGERIGFRPEWGMLDARGPLPGTVNRVRVQGTRGGEPYGLVSLSTDYGELVVRGSLPLIPDIGEVTGVRVQRYVAYQDGLKVAAGELV